MGTEKCFEINFLHQELTEIYFPSKKKSFSGSGEKWSKLTSQINDKLRYKKAFWLAVWLAGYRANKCGPIYPCEEWGG